jgi:hypothetical protein
MTQQQQFLKHLRTEYDPSTVTIFVARCFSPDGVQVLQAQPEASLTTQDALNALAVANGASSGRWGDQEIGQTLEAETVLDAEAVPGVAAIPAVPAVMQGDVVITPAVPEVPAVAAIPAVTHLRYGGLPVQF